MKAFLIRYGGLALFILGALFLAIGVVRGEHLTVLKKAIRICLECIGLG